MERKEFDGLRTAIARLEPELRGLKERLARGENTCQHKWSEPQRGYKSVTEFVNGAPVHRGSDMWYESVAVQREIPKWARTCSVCGKVEETTHTRDQVTKVPNF